MNVIQLIEKVRTGDRLLQEEREYLLEVLDTQLRSMKEKDPRSYLDLLNLLMDAVKRASRELSSLTT